MNDQFNELPLKEELISNLVELKFNSMTPIQAQALPVALAGKDLMGQAKTGSGKTAVFGLTVLNSLDITRLKEQSLILCPTRELAEQVAKEIRTLARLLKNIRVLTLCGGLAQMHQEKSLTHGAHIIVGTPGRVERLLKNKVLSLQNVRSFILDEADKMLDMGFYEDIMAIKSYLPAKVQSMLFSATYPDEIKKLGQNVLVNAIEIVTDTEHHPNTIEQKFFEVIKHPDKKEALLKILGHYHPKRSIVFCKTKQITDEVTTFLNKSGIEAAGIHGDLQQNERTTVLTKFSNRSLSVLVATDVAARGLDIQGLEAVINYDLPSDPQIYIHRIGRTGRAGEVGQAFSLFLQKSSFRLEAIEEMVGQKCKIEDLASMPSFNGFNHLPPMKTMYIGGGKKNKLRPGDILGALVGEAGLDPSAVGEISVLNIITFVAIKREYIDQTIERLRIKTIKNKKFKIGLA